MRNSLFFHKAATTYPEFLTSQCRLNFRDHGETHHLNEGLFHAARLAEVYEAVRQAAELEGGTVYIVGYSLGGNFALRLARQVGSNPISRLKHIFAISPVIDPWYASPIIDQNRLIKRYFYKKWMSNLEKKQRAFPELYDFSHLNNFNTVMAITDEYLPKYTEFADKKTYFQSYAIRKNDLASCEIDVTIITSRDDPVVPVKSLEEIQLSSRVTKVICDYGGHNGFFQSLWGPTWYEAYIRSVLLNKI